MRRLVVLLALLAAASLAAAGPAAAHKGGKAEPRISAGVSGNQGLARVLSIQLSDLDSGRPVRGARVVASAEMTRPHVMRIGRWRLREGSSGVYVARVRFAMAASWTVTVEVSGPGVVAARSRLPIRIEPGATAPAPPAGALDVAPLPTELEDELAGTDLERMAVLWLHGLAALGWIVGVVVMALALSTRPDSSGSPRARLAAAYREWGAWLHWSLVPALVVTGIYNTVYATPFPIVWRPSDFAELARIPYGALYEAILFVKLGLFGALLVTGTQVLLRTVRPRREPPLLEAGMLRALVAALGPPGILYLATVPTILAAVVALRYVHVLSHVALSTS